MTPNDPQQTVLDVSVEADRYARHRIIPWWDQDRLANAKVFVVGAGALGNEILKNLALLGVGQIAICDMDDIEQSNLTRSVLFRESDRGRNKAEVAAERVREINSEIETIALPCNVMEIGRGFFGMVDLVFGGLDSREARLYVNGCCYLRGVPFFDGAIEVLDGVARVFQAPGPCYECTLDSEDYKLLAQRKSCALLTREQIETGHIPTTATTSSIIAGIQVQEAIKWLHHGKSELAGGGLVFHGGTLDNYTVRYELRDDCPAHETINRIESVSGNISDLTASALLDRVVSDLGDGAVIEFPQEIVRRFVCPDCDTTTDVYLPLHRLTTGDALCPDCGNDRSADTYHRIAAGDPALNRTIRELGIAHGETVLGRKGMNMIHYQLDGDADTMQTLAARIREDL